MKIIITALISGIILFGCTELPRKSLSKEEQDLVKINGIIANANIKLRSLGNKTPSSWDEREKDAFWNNEYIQCAHISRIIQDRKYNTKDRAYLKSYLRKSKLNSRDIHFILDTEWGTFGTGMSALGMQCLGYRLINKSYYSGTGHRWQMQISGYSNYVYLRGNGTETGMIVDSWN